MTETIEELLEKYCEWCEGQGGECQAHLDGCNVFEAIALSREKCVWEWDGKHKAWVTPHRKVGTVNLKCYTFKGDDCPTCSKRIEETPQ